METKTQTAAAKHPYQVRKTTSGRTGVAKFIVVLNPGGRRVSVHPCLTAADAQAAADQLNIAAMVADFSVDPRPYSVRLAEAESLYGQMRP